MSAAAQMTTLTGCATSRGFAAGPVFLYASETGAGVREYPLAEDAVAGEVARFQAARTETRHQLQALADRLKAASRGTEAEIFANHLLLFDDPALSTDVERLIRAEKINAEAAVTRAVGHYRALFAKMNDPYLRERIRDIEDVERRLVRALMGGGESPLVPLTEPAIVVADDLTPSETMALPRDLVMGFATDRGSSTSHVALLARAMGIPAVVGLGSVSSRVKTGDPVLLDGANGAITLHPDASTEAEFRRLMSREKELRALLADPDTTSRGLKDGTPLAFLANVQPGVPFATLSSYGAQGIGLYRSEYLWMGETGEPSEDAQFAAYAEAVQAMRRLGPEARVTFRVLDLGGDKLMKDESARETNPFLGNRSIRFLLTHRAVFRRQLRAILRASALGPCSVLFPMIADVQELREANVELNAVKVALKDEGVVFDPQIRRGAMIEIPSAALNAPLLAREADFFSIGTNDLVQYTMAADRGNPDVAYLYQPANPAVLKLVEAACQAAKAAGIEVDVCGESASDPVFAALWVGFGATGLSMSPSYIAVARKVFRALGRTDLQGLAAEVRNEWDTHTAAEIYRQARAFLMARVPDMAELESLFAVPENI